MDKILRNIFTASALLFSFILSSYAQSSNYTFQINDQLDERIYAIDRLTFYEDESNELGLADILSSPISDKLKINPDFSKNQFSTENTYWVKVAIQKTPQSEKRWLLEFYDQTIDQITAYIPSEDGFRELKLGDKAPFGDRVYSHKNFQIPVDNDSAGIATYYFKIKSSQKADIRIAFRSYNRFIYYALNEYFLYGIFYGMILIISLYNGLIYLAIKEVKYLYYVFYLMSVAIFAACMDGIAFQYLWPNHPEWNQPFSGFSSYLIVVFALLFSTHFLNLKRRFPSMHRSFQVILAVKTILFAGGIVFLPALLEIQIYDIIPFFLILFSSIYVWVKGYSVARLFVIAYGILFLGVGLKAMVHTAVIPHSTVLYYSLHIAFLLEMLLLTLALGDRVKILKDNRDRALLRSLRQAEANAQLKEKVNRELEQRVDERTQELEKKNQLLLDYNQQILAKDEEIKRINSLLDKDIWKLKSQIKENLQARITNKRMSYADFKKIFPDSSACLRYLEQVKWENGFTCKACEHGKFSKQSKIFHRRCSRCGHIESATAGTIFHGIRLPLEKAFYLSYTVIAEHNKLTLEDLSKLLDLRVNAISSFRVKVKLQLEFKGIHYPDWEDIVLERSHELN
ncbi:7TM diverse intracellular signaling domain-containing protein [Algoriphagus sp. D3-2-R+10]|uniref:7TM diverse intracellular signaling domain-containing protein n=1 Tax=Algoriphagus aurantiacus TaxID=3103948 RepID=UPI002B3965DB|nr:7TM diverse intracellular signaling domain-containing protein [Algoriphagus sp. D3-2-R+10]MEB2775091.1 7TM diverse intracellular signaling domain-containing protein [Algoriphagus sp. D3-2-R+10]